MSLSLRARRDAATQEDVAQQWRDWCQYLRAQLRLLDARSASAQHSAFEHDESWEDVEAAAQADLDAIPMLRRALFQAICAERRQIVQQEQEQAMRAQGSSHRLLDPDAIDRTLLTVLLREAEGSQSTDGWGQVPCGTAEQPEWYRVDVAALNDAPSAALYALGQSAAVDRKRRVLLLGGLVGISVLLLMLWAIWPVMPAAAPALDMPAVLVNGQPLTERWQPQTLILRSHTTTLVSLSIVAASTPYWPPESPADTSVWQATTLLPLTLCVPGSMLADASEAIMMSAGDAPERRYQLREATIDHPDLRLESCGTETRPTLVRYGLLQETRPPQNAQPGAALPLQSGYLTLRTLTVIGAGDDPTLPDGQVRVQVDVSVDGDLALDWPALAPTLLLAHGDALLPSDIQSTDEGVTLIYLAPVPTAPAEVVWMITAVPQQHPLRWRTSIAPPPGRAEILQRMLLLEQVSAVIDETDQIRISIQLRNRGDHPIMLTSTDIVVLHGAQVLSTPPIPDLASPLAAGAARTLTISLPHTVVYQPLTLIVGSQQARLRLP